METILECRKPPPSPELSRLVTKRRCPFGESPRQHKIPATEPCVMASNGCDESSSDCAFQLLMNNQRKLFTGDSALLSNPPTSTALSSCWICQQQGEAMPCTFCDHSVCEMCVRQCDRCLGVFCVFCSIINYDSHDDQPLCLTCHHEAPRKQRSHVSQAGPLDPSSGWDQACQEGFNPITA